MSKKPKLTPKERHEFFKDIYRVIPNVKHRTHFKAVMRDGEICVIRVDDNGNEIKEN